MRATSIDLAEVTRYANLVTGMIAEDMAEIPAMRAAQDFSDLHEHVDANMYMIDAGVPYAGDMDDVEYLSPRWHEVMDFYVFVQDEVSRRLGSGTILQGVAA